MKKNGKRKASRQERQAGIIAAAAALFARRGFTGATTKAIARTAGCSEALVFKYFPTKRALYAAILAEKVPLGEMMVAMEDAAKKKDDRLVFTTLARHRIRRNADPTLLRLLLFSALEGHELSKMFFKNQHRVFYDYLAAYIEQRTRDGAFRRVDPLLGARSFMGLIAHHRLLHELFGVALHRSQEECIESYVSLFLNGIQTNGGKTNA